MKGRVDSQQEVFFTLSLEKKVPQDHPLRRIKRWADQVLRSMHLAFEAAYSHMGRPGVRNRQRIIIADRSPNPARRCEQESHDGAMPAGPHAIPADLSYNSVV
jgi:hypothetical protein